MPDGPAIFQSALNAAGPRAAAIERLWWLTFGVTTAVYVVVMAAVIVIVVRTWRARRVSDVPLMTPDEAMPSGHAAKDHEQGMAAWLSLRVGLAVAATVLILFGLLVADLRTGRAIASPGPPAAVVIELTGHQWWWEAQYEGSLPSQRFTTANELHIPVGRPVVLKVTSQDVIHSFWVPNLHGKRDLIPGYTTAIWIQADREGIYRGQCAEFCGHQHANMGLFVIAEPEEAFAAWRTNQERAAVIPGDGTLTRGRDVFVSATCNQCHRIRGTVAGATMGPDLTHLMSRGTIAAARLENTRELLTSWILDPQRFKPGNQMPPTQLAPGDLDALVSYLRGLQ